MSAVILRHPKLSGPGSEIWLLRNRSMQRAVCCVCGMIERPEVPACLFSMLGYICDGCGKKLSPMRHRVMEELARLTYEDTKVNPQYVDELISLIPEEPHLPGCQDIPFLSGWDEQQELDPRLIELAVDRLERRA